MKKLFVSYANCQSIGIFHFLKQTRLVEEYEFKLWNNWQIVLKEQDPAGLFEDARRADVFLYQPTDSLYGALSTDAFCNEVVPKDCIKISYPYVFNSGFFPIVKHGRWFTGADWITEAKAGATDLLEIYDRHTGNPRAWHPSFDCARRFSENLAEQSRREEDCTIRLVPWMLQNFQTKHLFLLCNHPASALLVELAKRVMEIVAAPDDHIFTYDGPNDANLPGWHALHPAVKRELGITYDAPGGDMEFYRTLIKELAQTKGVL